MSSDRHRKISDLFLRACGLEPEARGPFLERACGHDLALRAEVESLLAHDPGASALMKTGGGQRIAAQLGRASDEKSVDASWRRSRPAICPACGTAIPTGCGTCPTCGTRTVVTLPDAPAIGGYRILKLLGEGGMGRVYLADEEALGRRVAIKTIAEGLAGDERKVGRFLREARLMAAVEHPHIVRLYSFGQADGQSYLVMEYVEGESLADRLRRSGRLDVQQSLRILDQTLAALEAAWEHGIIHRDVKPSNILLDARDRVRVADFGVARVAEHGVDQSITRIGELVGTPRYISPEQARAAKNLDFRTDVYSLGIVLYEMLAGRPPFAGETPFAILDQHLHTPVPSLRRLCPEAPGELEQLVEWMTRKQPADRPDSYAELRRGVAALSGAPVEPGVRPLPPFLVGTEEQERGEHTAFLFVGRERELTALDRALEQALAGRGCVRLLTGEAGSGKTALTDEFARRAQETHEALIVVQGHCDAQTGTGDPYLPFRDALSLLTGDVEARRASGAITREHAARLWRLLPVAAQALVDAGPDLIGTFIPAAPLVSRAMSFTPSPAGWRVRLEDLARRNAAVPRDVSLQQSHLFDQYTRLLQTLAERYPLLLVLEDLHWADAGSCSLLFHLARRIAGSRVLVVCTCRRAEIEFEAEGRRHPMKQVLHELRRQQGDLELPVGESGSREFLDALLDSVPNRLGAEFREALYHRTQGHPLFTVELLRTMRDQGMLVDDREGHWIEGAGVEWDTLPARVEGAVGERIDRLPEELQRVLGLASVQGEHFIAEVLATVQGGDPRAVVALLSRELNQRHRLVAVEGVRRVDGRRVSTYRFRHSLFQTYLYGRLDDVERTYLHEEVGTALEKLFGDAADEVAVQLARHYLEAGIHAKSIDYLRRAGARASGLSANDEAIEMLHKALALLDHLPKTPERARLELALLLALGPPLLGASGPASPDLYRALSRARALCEEVGEAPQLFQSLFLLVHYHCNRVELETALELADRLLEVAEGAEEPLPVVMAHWARGFVRFHLGRFAEGREAHDRVIATYEPGLHAALARVFGMDPGVSALGYNALASWYLGFADQAQEYAARGLRLARELEHPTSLGHILNLAAFLAAHRRDSEALEELSDCLLRHSTDRGIEFFRSYAIFLQGHSLVQRGRFDEGIARMREGDAAVRATGGRLGRDVLLAMLAEAHGKAGAPDEGLVLVSQALSPETKHEPVHEPELHRIRGDLLLARAGSVPCDHAETCYRRAIDSAQRLGSRSQQLRASVRLSRHLASTGRRDEGRHLLAEIHGWFTEGLDTPDLCEARALLGDLA